MEAGRASQRATNLLPDVGTGIKAPAARWGSAPYAIAAACSPLWSYLLLYKAWSLEYIRYFP